MIKNEVETVGICSAPVRIVALPVECAAEQTSKHRGRVQQTPCHLFCYDTGQRPWFALELHWNCTRAAKFQFGANRFATLELDKISAIPELHWNCSGVALKLHRNGEISKWIKVIKLNWLVSIQTGMETIFRGQTAALELLRNCTGVALKLHPNREIS